MVFHFTSPHSLDVTRAHYHGKYSFEGNQARKVLKHSSTMRLMVPALPRFQRSMVIQVIEVIEPFDKDSYPGLLCQVQGNPYTTKFHMVIMFISL